VEVTIPVETTPAAACVWVWRAKFSARDDAAYLPLLKISNYFSII
jgi:hypothetical protein